MDLRVKAAGFFLCNDDLVEALRLLDEAYDNAEGIPEDVIVLDKYEWEDLDTILELIQDLEDMLVEVWNAAIKL